MYNIEQNIYGKRLKKLNLKLLILFFVLNLLLFISEITVIYIKFIPKLLASMQDSLSPSLLENLSEGFDKIILRLSVWAFFFFVICSLLIYVFWNIKKFFQSVDS